MNSLKRPRLILICAIMQNKVKGAVKMTVKEQVLKYLLKDSAVISGATFAEKLGVSRNAVWKAVEELRADGYQIEAVPSKGYRLVEASKQIDPQQIKAGLDSRWNNLIIFNEDEYDSTNNEAKRYLINHPQDEILFTTNRQTAGRGRLGKGFYSELEHGLYFSVAVKVPKDQKIQDVPLYTIAAASSMCQVLDEYVDGKLEIKWVNDLFYKGRKVSGILSEMTTDLESQKPSHVIVGIGLNLAGDLTNLSDDLQRIVGTIFGEKLPEGLNLNEIIIKFLKYFKDYQTNISEKTFLSDYENRLLGRGKQVNYYISGEKYSGKMLGVNDMGHLLVEKADGSVETLFGQEISLKSQQFTK